MDNIANLLKPIEIKKGHYDLRLFLLNWAKDIVGMDYWVMYGKFRGLKTPHIKLCIDYALAVDERAKPDESKIRFWVKLKELRIKHPFEKKPKQVKLF